MKNKIFIILTAILLLTIFFTQFKLINRPVLDNDEGIYLTSFLLIDKGYPAYKQTYFSQPPGYLLSVYPGFILFGKTLQAARLTISLWSFIGLLAIIWIGYELKNKWVGLLSISLLFLIPYYFNQALTFQSDVIATTFSLLSFGSLLRYFKSKRIIWFIMAGFFLNFTFWTKFDITFVPAFIVFSLYLIKEKYSRFLRLLSIFLIISIIFFGIFILPFGFIELFNNSILLRFQAIKQASSPWLLIDYLKKDIVLSFIFVSNLILSPFIFKKTKFPVVILSIWTFTSFIFFLFYRPLFTHHLSILSVPAVFLFSCLIYFTIKPKEKILMFLVLPVLAFSVYARINITLKSSQEILNFEQKKAIEIILKNTGKEDFVVSDEEILTGISGRLPPPELSDISFVRIKSNNLSPENFKKIVNTYKPKLIIPWNGRLESIENFRTNLNDYVLLTSFSDSKNIYIRIAP